MEIGSDDEKALTKSIQMCFPEAKRSLCTKHLKDNVSEYLKNKIGVNNSERHNVVENRHLHAINSHGKPYRRLLCAEVLVLETLSGH
jgi:transposase-like protein